MLRRMVGSTAARAQRDSANVEAPAAMEEEAAAVEVAAEEEEAVEVVMEDVTSSSASRMTTAVASSTALTIGFIGQTRARPPSSMPSSAGRSRPSHARPAIQSTYRRGCCQRGSSCATRPAWSFRWRRMDAPSFLAAVAAAAAAEEEVMRRVNSTTSRRVPSTNAAASFRLPKCASHSRRSGYYGTRSTCQGSTTSPRATLTTSRWRNSRRWASARRSPRGRGYRLARGRGALDVHRAGLEVLRDCVDGAVCLAFVDPPPAAVPIA